MITNKTPYFIKLRNVKSNVPMKQLSVEALRVLFEELTIKIGVLQKALNKNVLPSFKQPTKCLIEIDGIKQEIDLKINQIKDEIKNITTQIVLSNTSKHKKKLKNDILEEVIRSYFKKNLHKLIILYTNILQDHLKKSMANEIISGIAHRSNENLLNTVRQSVSGQMYEGNCTSIDLGIQNGINHSLINLTNVLMDLKINIKNQTFMIDSIDRYFESANRYLGEANLEISKIPDTYTRIKDKTIYFMIYVIVALLMLVTYKEYNKAVR